MFWFTDDEVLGVQAPAQSKGCPPYWLLAEQGKLVGSADGVETYWFQGRVYVAEEWTECGALRMHVRLADN